MLATVPDHQHEVFRSVHICGLSCRAAVAKPVTRKRRKKDKPSDHAAKLEQEWEELCYDYERGVMLCAVFFFCEHAPPSI